ncbi:hypothetical protein RHMOL_Rhmol02G0313400 [Rhododendron molle]|uniref:Uncharacterized protein n=1 Tax=Rhododendron molle TaxID=49168 RepID=A0ACC0PVW5_RHOML|nr:hypothetical protein RHMOL_Rhmol02G0313400 [Rhododendron molle]
MALLSYHIISRDSNGLLELKRNSLVLELDNMTKMAEKCDIQVPMQVVNLIDDGKNPDEFTKDVLNECIAKNQITKGKADAFKIRKIHEKGKEYFYKLTVVIWCAPELKGHPKQVKRTTESKLIKAY